jgi:hypothetical protein
MNLRDRKTPRTDADACWPACNDSPDKFTPDGGYVSADFARRLEQDRAALVEELEKVMKHCVLDRAYVEAAATLAAVRDWKTKALP